MALTLSGCVAGVGQHALELATYQLVGNLGQLRGKAQSPSDWKLLGTFEGQKLYVLQGTVKNGKGTFATVHRPIGYFVSISSHDYTETLYDIQANCQSAYQIKELGVYPSLFEETPIHQRALHGNDRIYELKAKDWKSYSDTKSLGHQQWKAICR